MKKSFLFAILGLCLFFSCSKDEVLNTARNKILPLGASRVEGNRPSYESFRYELWKQLVDGAWDFDFLGTMDDPASYPDHSGQSFDDDHEGRGGWTSGRILDGIDDWLDDAGTPDIVLFSSPGGNDALQLLPYDDIVDNVNQIIDKIQAVNPNVTIIIEQPAPGRSGIMTAVLTSYFDRIQQDILTIASEQSTATSKVITVNMFTGFEDALLADFVHYNEAGAKFIADRYYEVLKDVLQ